MLDIAAMVAEVEAEFKLKENKPLIDQVPVSVEPASLPLISDEQLLIETVKFGSKTNGAISTNSGLGATVTYQLIERLIDSGRLNIAKDGTITAKIANNSKQ